MKRIMFSFLLVILAALPAYARVHRSLDRVDGQYLVQLDDGTRDVNGSAHAFAAATGGQVLHVWRKVFKAFAIAVSADGAEWLSEQPDVQVVEEDAQVFPSTTTQTTDSSLWNLDRLDQTTGVLSGTYSYTRTGAAVDIYVVDTGVKASHDQFRWGLGPVGTSSTRVRTGYNVFNDGYLASNPCTNYPDTLINPSSLRLLIT